MTDDPGKVYLVPTPIGNMGDLTGRAIEVLSQVDIIACEDTRVSGRLLKKLEIKKKLISYHDFNEARRAEVLLKAVRDGNDVAIITDAGSPGISDPAYRVVRAAIDNGLKVIALPGPCAIIPALTASGLPTDRFFFEGFLPNRSAARRHRLERLADLEHTLVFFESPHRVQKTLDDMREVLGNRQACLAREITKKFEQLIRGELSSIREQLRGRTVRGEIVLVVSGRSRKDKST
jgi:16S rRNA (cytidine1402-2'-O)-methyltransferase